MLTVCQLVLLAPPLRGSFCSSFTSTLPPDEFLSKSLRNWPRAPLSFFFFSLGTFPPSPFSPHALNHTRLLHFTFIPAIPQTSISPGEPFLVSHWVLSPFSRGNPFFLFDDADAILGINDWAFFRHYSLRTLMPPPSYIVNVPL